MMKLVFVLLLGTVTAHAYVPTVESLYRHGANPDIASNGVVINLVVRKVVQANQGESVQSPSLLNEGRAEDFYKIYFNRNGDALKVSQARYASAAYAESSLEHKIYYPNFTAYTVKGNAEQLERGLFFSVLNSILFNNGAHMVNYLKSLGVPVRLNNDLINREKIEYLADYKRYLATISRDRNARKSEVNPLKPEDPVARARIDSIMAGPMYIDTKNVTLGKDNEEMAYLISAGNFSSVVSYNKREVKKLNFKSQAGNVEFSFKDHWLANGTHSVPRFINVRDMKGENYQIEIKSLRHYVEREDDLVSRLNRWEQVLRGKQSTEPRPDFLL